MVRVCVDDAPKASGSLSRVEIVLPGDVRLIVASDIDPVALRRIMMVVESR